MSYTDQYFIDKSGGLHFLSAQDQENAVAQGLSLPDPDWMVATADQVDAVQNPPLSLQQKAAQLLTSGLTITSVGTPSLNGTYAVDQLSQSDIIAIETGLNAGKGFPGGATTFGYQDASGVAHEFSEASFTDLAAAVRDFVYAIRAVTAGSSSRLPTPTASIA